MGPDCWAASVERIRAQGDILSAVPHGVLKHPVKLLHHANIKGSGSMGWAETLNVNPDADGMVHYLQRGRHAMCMLLSYGCDIDKQADREHARFIVVPARSAPANVLTGRPSYHIVVLRGVPTLGDCCVDLRCMSTISSDLLAELKPTASMTPLGIATLQAHIVAFLTRIDISEIINR